MQSGINLNMAYEEIFYEVFCWYTEMKFIELSN